MGTPMGSPATSAWLAVVMAPSTRETSVEVPPMSKAMMRSKPLRAGAGGGADHASGGAGENGADGFAWRRRRAR